MDYEIRIWAVYYGYRPTFYVQAFGKDNRFRVPSKEPYEFASLHKARCRAKDLLPILNTNGKLQKCRISGECYFGEDTAKIVECRPLKKRSI